MISRNSTIEPGHPWVTISGKRVGLGRAGVDEVHPRAVDLGEIVVERVERRLRAAPVVLVAPVRDELDEVAALGAVVPSRVGKLLREARAGESFAQVVEVGIGDLDGERFDGERHGGDAIVRAADLSRRRATEDHVDHTYKITEIVGSSPDGIDDAIRTASGARRRRCATSTGSRSPTSVAR